jgi:hypothetical protein
MTARRQAQPATLFDAAPSREPVAHVAPEPPAVAVTGREVGVGLDREVEGEGRAQPSGETLDRLVVGGWERLTSRVATPCLLCGGTMEPTYGVQSKPIGGRCRDCGTTLS